MDFLWKNLQRCIIIFTILFVSANAIAYFLLNNEFVHSWFRNHMNQELEKIGLEASIGTILVNFFDAKISISSVRVVEKGQMASGLAKVDNLVIGFDIWNLNSYGFPSTKFVEVEDWSVDAKVIEKLEEKSSESKDKAMTLSKFIQFSKIIFGQQFELKNGRIEDTRKERFFERIPINSAFLKFTGGTSENKLTLISDFGKSEFCLKKEISCGKLIQVNSLEIRLELNSRGELRLEKVALDGQHGNWQVEGRMRLSEDFSVENYSIKIDGNADASPWFRLADLTGRGQFKASLFVNPQSGGDKNVLSKNLEPVMNGNVIWNSVNLSDYDIYSGSADVQFANSTIVYKNANIVTPSGARIFSNGEYDLKDSMHFVNTARIRDFSFAELMNGLGVPTDVVNFRMDTDSLLVTGSLHAEGKKGFLLSFSGPVGISGLSVPKFEPSSFYLPNCMVDLRIDSDAQHMSFLGSAMRCGMSGADKNTTIQLSKGLLDYRTSLNDFSFSVRSASAGAISYFVSEAVDGEFDLEGSIRGSKNTSAKFSADVKMNEASIFGLELPHVSGSIVIDHKGFSAKSVQAWLNEEKKIPDVKARHVYVGFSDRKVDIDASFNGQLSDVLRVFGKQGRQLSDEASGDIRTLELRLRGDRSDLLKSNVDMKIHIQNLSHPWISSSDVRASFVCQQGWCSDSRVFMTDLFLGDSLNSSSPGEKLEQSSAGALSESFTLAKPRAQPKASQAIFEIESISDKSLSLRWDVQSVPFSLRAAGDSHTSGILDLRGSLQGGTKDWETSAQGRIDRFEFGPRALGSLSFNALSHGGAPLSLIVSGLYDQLQARLIFDHSFSQSSQLFVSLRSLDYFKYIPQWEKMKLPLVGELYGDFQIEGPGLRTMIHDGENLLEALRGRGEISQLRAQLGQDHFVLTSPFQFNLADGRLSYSPAIISGNKGKLRTQGSFQLTDRDLSVGLDAQIDSSILSQTTDFLTHSSGNISLRGELRRTDGEALLRGEAQFENVVLAGKYLTPPLSGMNGRVIFQNSRIEIPSLAASKGNGQIDLAGTIDFASDNGNLLFPPQLSLRANLKSAQFRWPQDFFETVETTVDGQVDLQGTGKPYFLNGDLKIVKGRAYRDATCQEIIRSGSVASERTSVSTPSPWLRLNLGIEADNSFTLQSACIRGRVSSSVRVSGFETEPVLAGQIRLDNGVMNLLKTRFEVTRADAVFDNLVKIEPRLDAQMVAKIDKYSVFVGAEGPLSKPRLSIWSDPSTGPDGTALSRPTLIRMISTGRGPLETTQVAVTQAIANQVVGFFDDPLSQAVSKITRGFVDRFELQPILDGGQSSWRARASRDLGEKFNLGLDYEPNKQSLTGTIFINESVNVLGGFDHRSSQLGSYSELSGGFRFQFGGK